MSVNIIVPSGALVKGRKFNSPSDAAKPFKEGTVSTLGSERKVRVVLSN